MYESTGYYIYVPIESTSPEESDPDNPDDPNQPSTSAATTTDNLDDGGGTDSGDGSGTDTPTTGTEEQEYEEVWVPNLTNATKCTFLCGFSTENIPK